MFLTPQMSTRDLRAPPSVSTAMSTATGSHSFHARHQSGSQRETIPIGRLIEVSLPGDMNRSYHHYEDPHSVRRLSLQGAPSAAMAAPAHDAYYLPVAMRDLPHRLPARREHRAMPYARPHDAQPRPTVYATFSNQSLHRIPFDSPLFPRDHSVRRFAPESRSPTDRHDHRVVTEAAYSNTRHAPSTTGYYAAECDRSNDAGQPLYASHLNDWRNHPPGTPLHPRWASPPPLHPPPPPPLPSPPPLSPLSTPLVASPPISADVTATSPPSPTVDAAPPDLTLVGQLCAKRNCYRQACPLYGDFCEFHKPSRLCKVPACRKCAKTGGYCIGHGGGRRCQVDGCIKSAKEGGRCIAHGGGKRCHVAGCDKAATANGLCAVHV